MIRKIIRVVMWRMNKGFRVKGSKPIRWHLSIYQYFGRTVPHPVVTTSSGASTNFTFLSLVQNAIMRDFAKYFDGF